MYRDMRALRFLVRRWNPNTHTFFFPRGQTIVTLEGCGKDLLTA